MASGMFFKVDFDLCYSPDGVLCPPLANLKGAPLSVFMALGCHLNKQGSCWPGLTRLSKMTGYSVRQVRRALRSLEELGYISTSKRMWDDSKKQTSNLYIINKLVSFGKK
jgi:DNA-binding MarR family transcriptional regulator